jgi:hypothetical protein
MVSKNQQRKERRQVAKTHELELPARCIVEIARRNANYALDTYDAAVEQWRVFRRSRGGLGPTKKQIVDTAAMIFECKDVLKTASANAVSMLGIYQSNPDSPDDRVMANWIKLSILPMIINLTCDCDHFLDRVRMDVLSKYFMDIFNNARSTRHKISALVGYNLVAPPFYPSQTLRGCITHGTAIARMRPTRSRHPTIQPSVTTAVPCIE